MPPWTVLLGAVMASLAALPAGAHAHAAQSTEQVPRPWIPRSPSPGNVSALDGAYCVSAVSCFAVGYYVVGQASERNQVLRWDGRRWAQASVPQPGGTGTSAYHQLTAIRCTGPQNCWAVGGYGHTGGAGETLLNEVLHWNGRKWFRMVTPNPGGNGAADFNVLQGLRCNSASSCLAVGTYGSLSGSPTYLNESMRWNGRRWSLLTTPDPAGTSQGAVNTLLRLTCASPRSCWAVGAYGSTTSSGPTRNEVLHWDGHAWTVTSVPDPGAASNTLFGVYCSAARSCWAVGEFGYTLAGGDVERNVALRWSGARWSRVTTPDPAGTAGHDLNELLGVRCASRTSCWAVGFSQVRGGRARDEILHWNGRKWSVK